MYNYNLVIIYIIKRIKQETILHMWLTRSNTCSERGNIRVHWIHD